MVMEKLNTLCWAIGSISGSKSSVQRVREEVLGDSHQGGHQVTSNEISLCFNMYLFPFLKW